MTTAGDRYLLRSFDDGSVLFDLQSGTLFQLNETAAFVWERANQGESPETIATSLARTFRLDQAEARLDVDAALSFPDARPLPPIPSSDLRYEVSDGGICRLTSEGAPVLEIRVADLHVRTTRAIEARELGMFLRVLTPKVISLGGTAILHASAVARPNGTVTAFLGRSGAGKTTTARMFVKAGWTPVCEDKLVLRRHQNRLSAAPDFERQIDAWMASATAYLADDSHVGHWYDAGPVAAVPTGPFLPLTDFIVLDVDRRQGAKLELESLGRARSVAEIFQHSFYGSSARANWSRQIEVVSELAGSSRTYRAYVPLGLASLEQETARYALMTTS